MTAKEKQVIQYLIWMHATGSGRQGSVNIHGQAEAWTTERLYKLWEKYCDENNL